MNRYNTLRGISAIWLLAALVLAAWSVNELVEVSRSRYSGIWSGAFAATLIGLVYSILAIGGGAAGIAMVWSHRFMLALVAWLTICYFALFLLFGGVDDVSNFYALSVAGLSVLAVGTLILLYLTRFPPNPAFNRTPTGGPSAPAGGAG